MNKSLKVNIKNMENILWTYLPVILMKKFLCSVYKNICNIFNAIKKQQKNVSDVIDVVHGSLLWVFTVFAG